MHSKGRGRARSKSPLTKKKPTWLKYKSGEIELLVVKLAKEGHSTSRIGILLRDSYGIPDVHFLTKKKITQILSENKISPELPEDIMFLIKKRILIKKHLDKNKKDMPAKRGLQLTESKIHRLTKYYKRENKLSQKWNLETEKFIVT